MTDYIHLKRNEKAQETVENLLANKDSDAFTPEERQWIGRYLSNKRFIREVDYKKAQELEAKL